MFSRLSHVEPTVPPSSLRRAVDPGNTLPFITLLRDDRHNPWEELSCDREPTHGFHIMSDDRPVGRLALAERDGTDECYIADIHVDEIGGGYGTAAHLLAAEAAAEEEMVLACDRLQSAEAVDVWRRLARIGVAEILSPFVPSDDSRPGDQQVYYTGHARIDESYL